MKGLAAALERGAKGLMVVATACGTAGIVIGVITQTGLGLKFSSLLVELSRGNLVPALLLTMVAGIVLGMGLPPTAAYIVLAAMGAPALVKMGLSKLAAHLFIFYWSCLAPITPPVALAAYAGAGIAGAEPMTTGWTAFRLGLAGFIVPYMFVFGPQLLAQGSFWNVGLAFITASLGVFALALAVVGWLTRPLSWLQRAVALVSALLLIRPGLRTDLVGIAILGIVLATAKKRRLVES